ncbi:MAG: hypothetical protein ACTHJ5_12905 [Ilyomonas sp.]
MHRPLAIGNNKWLNYFDIILILIFSAVPLFLHFPYRINIFLSWEGAYRLYLGEVPYKDFGLPMGFGYWIVPAIFFKIFGPYLFTLIKAQFFLNIVAGLSFRGILKKLKVDTGIRVASVAVFCISYIFINFWPWYNNSVIIYEIIGIYFMLVFITGEKKSNYIFLSLSTFFTFLSFFTKQDGGFFAFVIAFALILYHAIVEKKWKDFIFFLIAYVVFACIFIVPFLKYNFAYWFNHGQPPHTARISIQELLEGILGESQWIKFYFLLIVLLLLNKFKQGKQFFYEKRNMLFLILTIGILGEAAIFQVTSYVPEDNNIFFHSFAFAYVLTLLLGISIVNYSNIKNALLLLVVVFIWWSGMYWKYFQRIADRFFPQPTANIQTSPTGENVINRHTYMLNLDTTDYEDESTWTTVPDSKAFDRMYLPPSTVAGIQRIRQMPVFKKQDVKVLNMTELTPLDYELGYKLEKGTDYPLWFHLGVGMFNKQTDAFCDKIKNNYYDVVMFEYVPPLNNFYPFRVRDTLQKYYNKVDTFFAPRRPTNGYVEVYLKK